MFLVGLTGGIATGKSSVVNIFRSSGIEIIDADIISREVVKPGKKAWKKIRKEFGEAVFHKDGTLNRPALREIVFNEPEKRAILNSITHPEIYKSILWRCLRLFLVGHQFSVIDLPLLYESGKMVKYLHKVIVVRCDSAQQLERLMLRDSITEADALAIINSQMKLEDKCKLADYVIDNSKDAEFTRTQVSAVLQELRSSRTHWKIRLLAAGVLLAACGLVGGIAYGLIYAYS